MRSRLLLLPLAVVLGCNNAATTKPDDGGGEGVDGGGGDAAPTGRTLVLLHTNDEHSHVLAFSPEVDDYPPATTAGSGSLKGGLARRSVIFAQERMKAKASGAEVLTVSAGDNTMGTLTQVPYATLAPDFTLMKALGYDVSTLGNHEFDYGPASLASALTYAQAHGGAVPTVSSNIQFSATDPADDTLAALFDETGTDATRPLHRSLVVTTASGLKVGFVGLVGAQAAEAAPFKAPVTFSLPATATEADYDLVDAQIFKDTQAIVDHLRNDEHVDLVVALSHCGVDNATPAIGEDYKIAVNVTGLDVIVSGHSHSKYPAMTVMNPKTNRPVLIQQAGFYGQYVGKITAQIDPQGVVSFDLANSNLIPVDDTIVADPQVGTLVGNVLQATESDKLASGKSFVEQTLSRITGLTITDDPAKIGDLVFYPIGMTGFDLVGV